MYIYVCVFLVMFFLGNSRKITLTSQPVNVDRTQYPCIFVKESVLRYIKPHKMREVLHHCSTLQHTAAHCSTLQQTAAHCSTLLHTAIHNNALQYTATQCNLHTTIDSHIAEPNKRHVAHTTATATHMYFIATETHM